MGFGAVGAGGVRVITQRGSRVIRRRLEGDEGRTHRDGLTGFGMQHRDDARDGRRQFDGGLGGLDVGDDLVEFDVVAD